MLKTANPRFKLIYEAFKPFIDEYGIRNIAVFGSYANGTEKAGSDIDIIVEMSKQFGLFKYIGLKQDIEKQLGMAIDLVERQCLEPLLKDSILASAVTIYEQR
ncbi:MAG: nucleotidyltransferase family protein [Candidatus Cloacimonetes bacterium]|nr:nucleotidyltransferase family protein [Candidatus Cloacimonadota bacterium]